MATKDNKYHLCPLLSGDISLNGGKSRLTSTTLRSSSSQTGEAVRMVNSSETSPSHPDLSTLNNTSSPTHHTIIQCARTTNSLSSQNNHLINTFMAHQSSPPSTSTNPLDLNSVFSHKMFETSILLQTSDEEGSTTQIEPLPNLDYHLLYTLIQLARFVISCHVICSYTWSHKCPCVSPPNVPK